MDRARRTGPSPASRLAVLGLLLAVGSALGVSIGGALLAAFGVILAIAGGVVGLTFWRRRRRPVALAAYVVAALGVALAIIGFVDAVG